MEMLVEQVQRKQQDSKNLIFGLMKLVILSGYLQMLAGLFTSFGSTQPVSGFAYLTELHTFSLTPIDVTIHGHD